LRPSKTPTTDAPASGVDVLDDDCPVTAGPVVEGLVVVSDGGECSRASAAATAAARGSSRPVAGDAGADILFRMDAREKVEG
jgi:hypothetical protein